MKRIAMIKIKDILSRHLIAQGAVKPNADERNQTALHPLVLDRKVGEYELPDGASLIACGNRDSGRGVVKRMPTPLTSRFVHLETRIEATDLCVCGVDNGIALEVMF